MPSIAYNQSGVLMAPFNGNTSYVFATKDVSNYKFQIKLTSMQTSNSSFGFSISLYQGGYNNIGNKTCEPTCNGTLTFARINTTIYPTQFACSYG